MVPGSNFVKEPKPQVHLFFYKRPPNMGKMAFLDVFGGFRAVTSPDFTYMRAVRIFLRALVGVYQFPKNLSGRNSIFGDIEAQKWSKNAKNAQNRPNCPFPRIFSFEKSIGLTYF